VRVAVPLVPALWFIQADISSKAIWDFGLSVGMLIVIIVLWREDRKSREKVQEASDQRYQDLVGMLTGLVQYNTQALTELRGTLAGKVVKCPYAGEGG